jgi:hypothetical protein
LRAATVPRATNRTRISSFFISRPYRPLVNTVTVGDGPLGVATRPAALESPIDLDDTAVSDGQVARITGTIACEAGSRFRLEVSVTQGETEGQGLATEPAPARTRSYA